MSLQASQEKTDKYSGKGLTGLANLGNTCFLNSCCQCLSHMYELNDYLDKDTFKKHLNKKPETLILLEWNKLRKMIWSENCIIKPGGFVTSIQKVARIKDKSIFTGFAQNDLTEFLIFMIDCFHTAIQRKVQMNISGDAQSETDILAQKCFNMMKTMYGNEYSEFLQLFYGISISKIETETGDYINATPEPFLMLDLALPQQSHTNNKPCTLKECLDQYTKAERLDGDNKYYHEEKDEKVVAKKQMHFWSLPDVLIITLKRFSNSVRKNQCLVDYPLENLDMSSYVIGYDKNSYVYDLFGICNHSGGVFGGHYTAYVKNANSKWYHFNDSSVNEIKTPKKMISPMSYCLFYRKKK